MSALPNEKTAAVAANDSAPKPPNRVTTRWKSGLVFESARSDGKGAPSLIDGNTNVAPGPVDTLLSSIATCAASDVVLILEKQRTPVSSLEVDVIGDRVDGVPRRLEHVLLRFRIGGAGIERAAAERAITLAVTKYCSVRDSLRVDIPVEWELELAG